MNASPIDAPDFLPFRLDLVGQRVLWLRLDAAQREAAAFLDERALPPGPEGGWLPLSAWLRGAPTMPARPAHAIAHIGHCGSTLLSRVLDTWPDVHALREPLPLRSLADAWPTRGQADARVSAADAERLLQASWAAWSRPLPPAQRSMVKLTSSCNGLLEPLLDAFPGMRVVLLDMPLRPWLATLAKSPDSMLDAAHAAPERLRLLQARGVGEDLALHAMTLPEQCAMGWLAERLRFQALAESHPTRALRVDFEALLARPGEVLAEVAAHLALDAEGLPAALASRHWGRYSKAQDHGYTREDRAHDLALALQRHGADIAEGERWLDGMRRRHGVALD
ncbi:sulfotransferase [Marilutibacter aestuarii]|uniref:Sulfotransferase n=1 Tax=Marilutibacter aestuarii TaxID=1706195 RepID=A0A508AF08_9GAMM|nr:sulfotransferase [Lysobacter aestuarii]TQD45675.1 sulfotransferase [Lysobacter aestuarii]